MRTARWALIASVSLLMQTGCRGSRGLDEGGCAGECTTAADFLTVPEVERIVAQGAMEAQARNARATIAVVDRVGNVLAVFAMAGADPVFRISTDRGVTGGFEGAQWPGVGALPSPLAAVAKAVTGAFLSSEGNAFSSRTASQIVQENFNPRERSQPSGPLYGVQFSQFACGDVMNGATLLGPRPSPLGLSPDPGGLPLYKDGRLVGGVGVISDSLYSLDPDPIGVDSDQDELISVGAAKGFMAPADRRGDRITADGRTFRFVDSEATKATGSAPPLQSIPGFQIPIPLFFAGATLQGTAFGTAPSGVRADASAFADLQGYVLVDERNQNRYPQRAGTDGLLAAPEVTSILRSGLKIANRTRSQIRRPLGSSAQVTVVVVDTRGALLGLARNRDAPVFGADVSVQKARTAAFFSRVDAAALLQTVPATVYSGSGAISLPSAYVTAMRGFLGDQGALGNGVAYSTRALGNLHRPFFPDGIEGSEHGPLSTPYSNWSPFHLGLQLDLVNTAALGMPRGPGCAFLPELHNGIQIFPGGVPIYRGAQLVGAIGVSGDGVDQDDLIAFLGLANAGRELNTGIANAPRNLRADRIEPRGLGSRLRYVQCPQAPFNDSTEQNVCADF